MENKLVSIAYSWDNEEHKEWVLNLASDLVKIGIDVIFDQFDLSVGKEMTYFMERMMSADKILVILTPEYKKKAEERTSGVGFEYSLLSNEILEGIPEVVKIIPILRAGNKHLSCPKIIATRIFHNMTDDKLFDTRFFELVSIIRDKPLIIKPPLGKLPEMDDSRLLDVERMIIKLKDKENLFHTKARFLNSERGIALYSSSVIAIIDQIQTILNNYNKNFQWYFQIKTTHKPSILFSTVQYTCFFSASNSYYDSDSDSDIILNLFQGPVGLDPGIDYRGEFKEIYKTSYKFDLDDELQPVFIRTDKLDHKFKPHEIATIAVRDLITREVSFRQDQLIK